MVDGAAEGLKDSDALGKSEGAADGFIDNYGISDGAAELKDNDALGMSEGAAEGFIDNEGTCEGAADGLPEILDTAGGM